MFSLHDSTAQCRSCPRPPGALCAGTDAPRLCQLVDPESPDYAPEYLPALVVENAPRPAPPLRPLAETLGLLLAMRACPDRDEATDCGCAGAARCARGEGRNGIVGVVDCFDCLTPRSKEDDRHAP